MTVVPKSIRLVSVDNCNKIYLYIINTHLVSVNDEILLIYVLHRRTNIIH